MTKLNVAIKYAELLAKEYIVSNLDTLSENDDTTGKIAYKVLGRDDFLVWLKKEIAESIELRKEFNILPHEATLGLYDDAVKNYDTFAERWQ